MLSGKSFQENAKSNIIFMLIMCHENDKNAK